MKKLLLLFLLIPAVCYAWGVLPLGGGVAEEASGGGTVSFVSATREIVSGGTSIDLDVPGDQVDECVRSEYPYSCCTGEGAGSCTATASTGDLLIATCMIDGDVVVNWNSNFTEIVDISSSSSNMAMAYRLDGGSESAYYNVSWTSNNAVCSMSRWGKTDGTWDVTEFQTDAESSPALGVYTTSAIDVGADSVLYAAFGSDDSTSISSPPSGMTLFRDAEGLADPPLYEYYQTYESAGSAVTKEVTWSSATKDHSSILISIEAN